MLHRSLSPKSRFISFHLAKLPSRPQACPNTHFIPKSKRGFATLTLCFNIDEEKEKEASIICSLLFIPSNYTVPFIPNYAANSEPRKDRFGAGYCILSNYPHRFLAFEGSSAESLPVPMYK